MKRYKAIFLLLILTMVCCLCGCHQQCSFSIVCEQLPDNYSIYILVKPADNDTIKDDPKQNGSEIYEYNEDSWIITDLLWDMCTTHGEYGSSILFEETDSLIGFCEQYKSIKVALSMETAVLSVCLRSFL